MDVDLTEETDRQLLARHVAGETAAFGELVKRHRDRLWGVAVRTLGDPEEAADALQDALISAYRRAGSYRGDAAVTTWLHRIVVNACLDLVRRRSARPVSPLGPEASDAGAVAIGEPMAARDLRLDITAALATLPIEQRASIVLVDIEGYPVEEAAAILQVPTGTVKSRCARGRARLAAALPAYGNRPDAGAVPPTAGNPPAEGAPAGGGQAAGRGRPPTDAREAGRKAADAREAGTRAADAREAGTRAADARATDRDDGRDGGRESGVTT